MEPINKQTQTTHTQIEGQTAKRVVGTLFGAIEILIALRLVLALFGANPDNGFVKGLYAFTGIFTMAFNGIFQKVHMGGADSVAVFEPACIISMVIIGLIAWFVLKMMTPKKDKQIEQTDVVSNINSGKTN